MYILEEQIYFYLLLVLPFLAILYVFYIAWKKTVQKKFADRALLKRLNPYKSVVKSLLKLIFVMLALACLATALVNPKLGTKLETVKREGVDIIFAVDVSKSMLAEDIAPNRIEKTKHLVSSIIGQLVGDRVGLIAYAAKAYPQLPITSDYASAKMFLSSMNTDMISSQGTAIDEAIILAKKMFDYHEQTNKILFIVSDGEDHGNIDIESSLEQLRDEGIRVFTIGIGTIAGAPIPIKENNVVLYYKKDLKGDVVITSLNEQILESISKYGNGSYINGNDTKKVLDFVKSSLQNMNKKEFETKKFSDFKDRFQWFLGAGLFFLLLDFAFLERKTKWLEKFNLFNERAEEV